MTNKRRKTELTNLYGSRDLNDVHQFGHMGKCEKFYYNIPFHLDDRRLDFISYDDGFYTIFDSHLSRMIYSGNLHGIIAFHIFDFTSGLLLLTDKKGWIQFTLYQPNKNTFTPCGPMFRLSPTKIRKIYIDKYLNIFFASNDCTINVFNRNIQHIYRSHPLPYPIDYFETSEVPHQLIIGQRNHAPIQTIIYNKTELIQKILSFFLLYDMGEECFYDYFYPIESKIIYTCI